MSNYINSCNSVEIGSVYSDRQWPRPENMFGRAVSMILTVKIWRERRKQRRELAELPPHLLKDIGISAEQAKCETAKPFWEA